MGNLKPSIYVNKRQTDFIQSWEGQSLEADSVKLLKVGNKVRVIVADTASKWREAIYVQIITIEGEFLTGTVLSKYRSGSSDEPLKDGETLRFHRDCITEIPHLWEGNENLNHLMPQGSSRITGV